MYLDIQPHRIDMAKQLGADYGYQVTLGKDPRIMAKELSEIFGDGGGPDKTLECTGFESSIQLAIYVRSL